MTFSVPILFIVWRRPHTTKIVLDAIRAIKPSTIYIACDGPRVGVEGESEKVDETRQLVMDSIDWHCDIKTRFSDVNLGCRDGVATAISWFFENVSEGIILEDDVVPFPEFFEYCQLCLARYRTDDRIWAISGNHTSKDHGVVGKYSFTPIYLRYNFNCWGWASWRNRWQHYSTALDSDWFNKSQVTVHSFCGVPSGSEILKRAYLGSSKAVDTWDYQACAIAASRMQYTINPAISLIRNVGFGSDATHTFGNLSHDYFHEVTSASRNEWIALVRTYCTSENLPPFIREVSDLAYRRPSFFYRLKALRNKLLELVGYS